MRGSGLIAAIGLAACSFTHGAAVGGDDANRDAPGDVVDDAPSVMGACQPLGPAANPIVVTTVTELRNAVATAPAGSSILLANGTYTLTTSLSITTPGLTLRSQSNDPATVTINGTANALLRIAASTVTIGAVTLSRGPLVAVLVEPTGSSDILGDTIYDVTFTDDAGPDVRMLPLNAADPTTGPYSDFGTIACSRFTDTSAVDHCAAKLELAIDAIGIRGWTIRDNTFQHVACPTRLVRAIWIRGGSRDTLITNNKLLDSNGNITLGNDPNGPALARSYTDAVPTTCSGLAGMPPQHRGGVVCNNSIAGLGAPMYTATGFFDGGLVLWGACETWALHNTIVSPAGTGTNHDIEYRYAGTYVHLVNNLTEAPPASIGGATLDVTYGSSNVLYTSTGDFVNALANDLHLSGSAGEAAGVSIDGLGMCQTDADGKMRTLASPVVGAFER